MRRVGSRFFGELSRDYRREFPLQLRLIDQEGRILLPKTVPAVERLPVLRRVRIHGLEECLRWGESQAFFVLPGVMGWIVPVVDREDVVGGLYAGYVWADDEPQAAEHVVERLVEEGARRDEAEIFVQRVVHFEKERIWKAVERLYELFYTRTGWRPDLLRDNRDRMQQQRQIAEEIHQRKVAQDRAYPYDEERILLSLIRAGDRAGARRRFNKMLAAMFLYSPKPVVVRARAIEMMGYLVRAAVEDSPLMEPLLERHMQWIERIVETRDFEDLCHVLREALDDFMNSIFHHAGPPIPAAVKRALDFIEAHYTEPISLQQIADAAGLSPFRIAHLLKESTGRTALQNVHHLRIREACRLLEETDLSCTEIAYEVGFSDQSYFIRQFRKWMGVTPARYRRARRSGARRESNR